MQHLRTDISIRIITNYIILISVVGKTWMGKRKISQVLLSAVVFNNVKHGLTKLVQE